VSFALQRVPAYRILFGHLESVQAICRILDDVFRNMSYSGPNVSCYDEMEKRIQARLEALENSAKMEKQRKIAEMEKQRNIAEMEKQRNIAAMVVSKPRNPAAMEVSTQRNPATIELKRERRVPGNGHSPSSNNAKWSRPIANIKANGEIEVFGKKCRVLIISQTIDGASLPRILNYMPHIQFSTILKTVISSGIIMQVYQLSDCKLLAESCYKVPGLKYPMHYAGIAFDASAVLDKCCESKNLQDSDTDFTDTAACLEHVLSGYRAAWLITDNGKHSHNTVPITRARLFKLLGGNPRENSAELTPWIAHLPPNKICEVMDHDKDSTISPGEVNTAKYKIFLVVDTPDQEASVDKLKQMLKQMKDQRYSQCIAWLSTLPTSNPEMPEPTIWESLPSANTCLFFVMLGSVILAPVLNVAGYTAAGTAVTNFGTATNLAGSKYAHNLNWDKDIEKKVTGQPFGGPGNKVGK